MSHRSRRRKQRHDYQPPIVVCRMCGAVAAETDEGKKWVPMDIGPCCLHHRGVQKAWALKQLREPEET